MSSGRATMRLPPLRALRIHNTKVEQGNPCVTVMSTVLACWASTGYSASGCASVEQALRACMDAPPPPQPPQNKTNYHLSRMTKNISGPRKHKGMKV